MKDKNADLTSPVLQNTLKLLAASLGQGEETFTPDYSLWPEIMRELDSHAVLSLVSDFMMSSALPEQDKLELTKKTAVHVRTFRKRMAAQTAAVILLRDNHIPVVVLKGAAAGQYYPRPELRQYGDIDLLVSPDDYKKAFDVLCSAGYRNKQEYHAICDRHIGFTTPEGDALELHRCFSGGTNQEQNDLLDGWLYDSMKNAAEVNVKGYSVPVFPTPENGLVLLSHINQHISSGLGLRQIIDWMLYVRTALTDSFWNEAFRQKAEAISMEYLAKAVTKLCRNYLGLRSECTWCDDVEDDLVDDLLLYIIKKGNFGQKLGKVSCDTISVMHRMAHPVAAFRYLTKAGSVHMQEAGLKPKKAYAWVYQIGRMLHITMHRKSKGTITQEIRCGIQEAELLKKLKVTRM